MIPWEHLDSTTVPGDGQDLSLYRRGQEYSIRLGSVELMNSRVYGSEEALAELSCARLKDRSKARVLIGGLGMGYTAAAALAKLGPGARVEVAELVPAVVQWNKKYMSALAGHPLKDKRVKVRVMDVAETLRSEPAGYDAIMLDVDNGPDGLTSKGNDWLYSKAGIAAAHAALRPDGVLAVWSAGTDNAFTKRLKSAGFRVQEHKVRARGSRGGSRYTVWLAMLSSR